jgi:hypothetical protein
MILQKTVKLETGKIFLIELTPDIDFFSKPVKQASNGAICVLLIASIFSNN